AARHEPRPAARPRGARALGGDPRKRLRAHRRDPRPGPVRGDVDRRGPRVPSPPRAGRDQGALRRGRDGPRRHARARRRLRDPAGALGGGAPPDAPRARARPAARRPPRAAPADRAAPRPPAPAARLPRGAPRGRARDPDDRDPHLRGVRARRRRRPSGRRARPRPRAAGRRRGARRGAGVRRVEDRAAPRDAPRVASRRALAAYGSTPARVMTGRGAFGAVVPAGAPGLVADARARATTRSRTPRTFFALALALTVYVACCTGARDTLWLADAWEHEAAVTALVDRLWQPGNPVYATPVPSVRYSPYSVALALVARASGTTPHDVL